MKRPKPTPGPWYVVGCRGGSLIESAGGARVVRGMGGVREPGDAMLIAAAPDLLAACEALLDLDNAGADLGPAVDQARAALAKAYWPRYQAEKKAPPAARPEGDSP